MFVALRLLVLLIAGALIVDAPLRVGADDGMAEELDYRLDDYRAPTPETVPGGHAIDTAEARALWQRGGAVWIDVLPALRRPPALAPSGVWKPVLRQDIPGSAWLPDVGRGALTPGVERYFRDNLVRLTGGDRSMAVVFYCLADCWMGWNATKRAAELGYTNLYWYRDGVDGWERAHLPTAEAHPIPPEL